MIIDWYTHCMGLMASRHLSREDPSDNKCFFRQEVVFIRFLVGHGCPIDEAKDIWLSIDNGTAELWRDDPEQLAIEFGTVFQRAMSRPYAFVDRCQPLQAVSIYQAEVDAIEAIKADGWVRKFLMGLLVFYKFSAEAGIKAEYSPSLVNWLTRKVIKDGSRSFRRYDDAREPLMRVIRAIKPTPLKFVPVQKGDRYSSYSVPGLLSNDGNVVCTIPDLNHIDDALALVGNGDRVCSKCGNWFQTGAKTKTSLCPICYIRERREYQADRQKIYRKKRCDEMGIVDRNPVFVSMNTREKRVKKQGSRSEPKANKRTLSLGRRPVPGGVGERRIG